MRWSLDDAIVTARPGVISRLVEASTVLLDSTSGRYFSLDAIGTRVWAHLLSTPTPRQAVEALVAEFDADPDVIRQDLERLVERLEAQGLVEVQRAGG
jgi:hypothetical protein